MIDWHSGMQDAPKDMDILVWYDHDADPYQDGDKLTPYAVWAESGDYMVGKGVCVARWFGQFWESTDEYGDGYWLPAWWFAKQFDDYECPCNPTHWAYINEPEVELVK